MYCFKKLLFCSKQNLNLFPSQHHLSTIQWLGREENVQWWADCHFPIAGYLNGMQFFILNNVTTNYLVGKKLYLFIYLFSCLVNQLVYLFLEMHAWFMTGSQRGGTRGGLGVMRWFSPLLLWPLFLLLSVFCRLAQTGPQPLLQSPKKRTRPDWLK